MARRYWLLVDGQKITDSAMRTLAHAETAAQAIATRLGKAVQVGYDNVKARAPRQLQRNPVGRIVGFAAIDQRGKVIWRTGQYTRDGKPTKEARDEAARWGFRLEPLREGDFYQKTFSRNPDPGSYLDVWRQQEISRRARLDRNAATKPRRLAKGHRARASQKAAPSFRIDVNDEREAWTFAAPTRAAANALARQYRAAGYYAEVSEA